MGNFEGEYVPTAIPEMGVPIRIQRSKLVVRDFDGSDVFEGFVAIETNDRTHETIVVLSTSMGFTMFEGLRKYFFIGSEEEPEENEVSLHEPEFPDDREIHEALLDAVDESLEDEEIVFHSPIEPPITTEAELISRVNEILGRVIPPRNTDKLMGLDGGENHTREEEMLDRAFAPRNVENDGG